MGQQFLIVFVSLTNLILASLVILRKKSSRYNNFFGLATAFVGMWGISTVLLNRYVNMFWERILFLSASSAVFFIVLFSSQYVKKFRSAINTLVTIFYFLFAYLILFTRLIVVSVSESDSTTGISVQRGPLYALFGIFIIFNLLFLILNLTVGLKKSKSLKKQQIRYIFVGVLLFVIPSIITNLILPILGINSFNNLGTIFSLFFTVSVTLSIIRHRLFSIRTLTLKLLKNVLLGVFFFIVVIGLRIIKVNFLDLDNFDAESLLIDFVFSVCIAFITQSIIKTLDLQLNRLLQGYVKNLRNITEKINESITLDYEYERIFQEILEILEHSFPNCDIYFLEKTSKDINLKSLYEIEKLDSKVKNFILNIKDQFILQEELENQHHVEIADRADIAIVEKLTENLFLVFTEKLNNEPFTKIELDTVEVIVNNLRDLFKKVEVYRKVKNFNKELQQKVDQATAELKEKVKALQDVRRRERDMIDIMGHELRTPLSIVKNGFGFLNMLYDSKIEEKLDKKTKKKVEKYFDRIEENIEREIKLLDNMLGATRLDKGKLELHLEKVDIIDVIEDGIVGQQEKAKEKALFVKFNKPENAEDYPRVFADRARSQEIMDNLLSNAVKYTEEGGVTIDIEHDEDKVTVHVKDTGIGIPEEAKKKLGKKFYRVGQYTEGSEKRDLKIVRAGGTGLGLYVTFGLVEAQGGKIWVDSKVGEGSTFHFTLPRFDPKKHKGRDNKAVKNLFERKGLEKGGEE